MENTHTPTLIEMHLSRNPEFVKEGWSKRVKKVGGKYTACRGHSSDTRFVTVPLTDEGKKLANELLGKFPRRVSTKKGTCCVFRGNSTAFAPAWVCVQYASQSEDRVAGLLAAYNVAYEKAEERNLIRKPETAAPVATITLREVFRTNANLEDEGSSKCWTNALTSDRPYLVQNETGNWKILYWKVFFKMGRWMSSGWFESPECDGQCAFFGDSHVYELPGVQYDPPKQIVSL
jgi:hypothetical protein